MSYPRVASLKNGESFCRHLSDSSIELPFDEEVQTGAESPLGRSLEVHGRTIGNRFCILPMEGWDGTSDGKPTDLTRRRWRNFGLSGAKLIWGGEAVAVRRDGRANPNQLMINEGNCGEIASLREELVSTHEEHFDDSSDLMIGLQLTHSGRYARPNDKKRPEPRVVQRNVVLDRRVGVEDDSAILTDDELSRLIDDFIAAAVLAERAGFTFVDVKHCHGYLGHELLAGVDRPGRFGGSFENRTRFLRDIVAGIKAATNEMNIGVRLSVFDFVPYCPGEDRIGIAEPGSEPRKTFGGNSTGDGMDLAEPSRLIELMQEIGIRMVCTTAGSPYYNPHIQRPAFFPPSDGYQPPEDPLVGVSRQVAAVEQLKKQHPEMIFIGSGYTYLQDYLPNVGQAVVARGMADSIGLGRMVLSYPELPADVIGGRDWQRKKVCRTFSDCTTAPREGIVSGCYPLDPFYKKREERDLLKAAKARLQK
ncbi:2,4-dienoyl-CoA reductase-like NADH-dependent reductase (Old Yellow Enzyme family) [Rhodopirellula rubra]|uniref:2,4-dienoyl-CoA reductase-like NADH-dependent reductase (Old Yellow Enzyme family) n=1 Tax=Aporhodopirellula rubra TaxID=980271 RepID=A0A7W5E5L0_9BACT|nr:NADH:flavin oxidoreductase [Aporhodopirellula rubra]MBB3209717.1 2,4-dienoyl-CoA reductase-like NADH-dependent reductase (Old Yellow Enzyme family) [Aporhodopirellula rubra]